MYTHANRPESQCGAQKFKISGAADIFDQLAQSDDVVEAHPMPVTERTQSEFSGDEFSEGTKA